MPLIQEERMTTTKKAKTTPTDSLQTKLDKFADQLNSLDRAVNNYSRTHLRVFGRLAGS